KLLALTPELSMADIGAGLGGPARTLAEQFGVWMTGYEQSSALVAAGNELSTMAGMAKKAPLQSFAPGPDFTFERRYDRAFLKESLHMIEDKLDLLTKLESAIKPEGLVLVIDYVLGDEAAVATPEYKAWRQGEPHQVFMVTQKELADLLTKAGFSLRVNEDQSDSQIALITHAWQGVDTVAAKLMENPAERHLVATLLKEAELWARRVAMLQSGRLRLVRMLGAKREKKASMMSNW
ncbi:MAG: methyltransferase domain-containing protein, partial [Alphaproteobacteria bacterium]